MVWPPSFQGQDFPSLGVSAVLLSVYWSVTIPTLLLSPCCQLDSWAEKFKATDATHAHNTFKCSSVQTHSSTKLFQPLTSLSRLIGQSLSLISTEKSKLCLGRGSLGPFPSANCFRPPLPHSWMLALPCVDTAGKCEEPDYMAWQRRATFRSQWLLKHHHHVQTFAR